MGDSVIALGMATSESWTPSRRLQSAALAERARVERRLGELTRRYAELAEALSQAASERDELREQLGMLSRLAREPDEHVVVGGREAVLHLDVEVSRGDAEAAGEPGSSPVEVRAAPALRGQAIREAAVQVLSTSSRAYEPVHYKDWFELMRNEGLLPAGKDPLATFLTQLGRSPVVARTSRQGVYKLDHDFPERARRKLVQLRRELRDAHDAPVGCDVSDVTAGRERRSALGAEVDRLERELEEALRSLAPEERPD